MATILVVDENPSNRQFLVSLLGYGGHRLLEAADGIEALSRVRAAKPDLVIIDIVMPSMDPYEFVRRLRSDPSVAQPPQIVFYTATYHEREAHALADACGVKHLISKPTTPEGLLRAISEILGVPAPVPEESGSGGTGHDVTAGNRELQEKLKEAEARHAKLTALLELGRALTLEMDRRRLIDGYCQGARNITAAKCSAVGMLSSDGRHLTDFILHGLESARAEQVRQPDLAVGLLAHVLAARRPVHRAKLEEDPDATVFLPPHPRDGPFLGIAVASSNRLYGFVYLVGKLGGDDFTPDDEQLLVALAAQLGVTYQSILQREQIQQDTVTLEKEVRERKAAETRLQEIAERLQMVSFRLVNVQEEERRRLAGELHDQIGQLLTIISINLQAARGGMDAAAQERLEDSIHHVDQAISQVRDLAVELRPAMLDVLGLEAALRWLVETQPQRAGVHGRLDSNLGDTRFEPQIEIAGYRIVQEAVTNAMRHAHAHEVQVRVERDHELLVTVSDDGVGFDVAAAQQNAARGGSFGLLSMQERVRLVAGQIEIHSEPLRGTEIRVRIPLIISPGA